jgi:hypothetical protein
MDVYEHGPGAPPDETDQMPMNNTWSKWKGALLLDNSDILTVQDMQASESDGVDRPGSPGGSMGGFLCADQTYFTLSKLTKQVRISVGPNTLNLWAQPQATNCSKTKP